MVCSFSSPSFESPSLRFVAFGRRQSGAPPLRSQGPAKGASSIAIAVCPRRISGFVPLLRGRLKDRQARISSMRCRAYLLYQPGRHQSSAGAGQHEVRPRRDPLGSREGRLVAHWHLHRCAGNVQIRHYVCLACQLGHITAGGGGQIVGRAFGEAESRFCSVPGVSLLSAA